MDHLTAPVFLLTDFGTRDSYVGQLKAVISGLAPQSPIYDVTHEIEPFAVDEAAWTLGASLAALPPGAVVLAVVDPGVGTRRRAVAVGADGRWFVGPDNGVLSPVFSSMEREGAAPGSLAPVSLASGAVACELASPQFQRQPVSPTFHGRDIFAPAAAALAVGVDWRRLGPPVYSLLALPPFCGWPSALGCIEGYVVHIDRYGNIITTIRAHQLFRSFTLEVGGRTVDTRVRTFAEGLAGRPFCHVDSSGFVAVALDRGSAAEALAVRRGDPVRVICQ